MEKQINRMMFSSEPIPVVGNEPFDMRHTPMLHVEGPHVLYRPTSVDEFCNVIWEDCVPRMAAPLIGHSKQSLYSSAIIKRGLMFDKECHSGLGTILKPTLFRSPQCSLALHPPLQRFIQYSRPYGVVAVPMLEPKYAAILYENDKMAEGDIITSGSLAGYKPNNRFLNASNHNSTLALRLNAQDVTLSQTVGSKLQRGQLQIYAVCHSDVKIPQADCEQKITQPESYVTLGNNTNSKQYSVCIRPIRLSYYVTKHSPLGVMEEVKHYMNDNLEIAKDEFMEVAVYKLGYCPNWDMQSMRIGGCGNGQINVFENFVVDMANKWEYQKILMKR